MLELEPTSLSLSLSLSKVTQKHTHTLSLSLSLPLSVYKVLCVVSFSCNFFFVKQRLVTEKEKLWKDPRKKEKKERECERQIRWVIRVVRVGGVC